MRVQDYQEVAQACGLPLGRRVSPKDLWILPRHADREDQDKARGEQERVGGD